MREQKIYFNNEALARFVAAQGKTVQNIICHLWQNNFNKEAPFDIIDNVELHFTDGQKLTICCNGSGDGLDAIHFDYRKEVQELEKEFEGKIKLFAINASTTKMWEDVIGKTLLNVRLSKEKDYYLADSLVLDFGEEKREIVVSPDDGLILDYFEED